MAHENKISFGTAILMNINIMVGSGIYVNSQFMAQGAGCASFLAWPIVALLFLPIVISIATISKLFPGAGSFYTYCKNGLNKTFGFISGWAFFLGYIGTGAMLTLCFRNIVLSFFPIDPILFNALFIGFITLLTLLPLGVIGKTQNIMTIIKISPLILVLSIFIFYLNPNFSITTNDLLGLPSIMSFAIFGYWGFECGCAVSHLVEGPSHNASRAILIAFFTTVALYALFHFGLLHIMGAQALGTLGLKGITTSLHIASPTISSIFGIAFSLILGLVFFNSVLGVSIANSTTLHSLAKEKLFTGSALVSKENGNQRPWVAILINSFLIFAFTSLVSSEPILISITNMGILTAFLLTLIALLLIQKKSKASFFAKLITLFAFAAWVIFIYASWINLGETTINRIVSLLPLIAGMIIGLIMFKIQEKKA